MTLEWLERPPAPPLLLRKERGDTNYEALLSVEELLSMADNTC